MNGCLLAATLVREGLIPTHTCRKFSCQEHTQGETRSSVSRYGPFFPFLSFSFFPIYDLPPPPATRFSCCLPLHWQPSSFIEYINIPLASLVTHACCVGQPFAPFSPKHLLFIFYSIPIFLIITRQSFSLSHTFASCFSSCRYNDKAS
jgi:hypothetical protein